MTDRLNSAPPARPKMSAQEVCEQGNLRLAGLAPYTGKRYAGQYFRRDDIRWVVRDGRPTLEWV